MFIDNGAAPFIGKVTFVNYDGSELSTATVEFGKLPEYNGKAPEKSGNVQYSYAFTGWDKAIVKVTEDALYTAVYTETVNKYKVTFVNADGSKLSDITVAYGTVPAYTGEIPSVAEDAQYSYTYTGWDKALAEVTGDATYTAVYAKNTKSYTVSYMTRDGYVLDSQTVAYGKDATAPEAPVCEGFVFGSWSGDGKNITCDTKIYPLYINLYTVTFKGIADSIIVIQSVPDKDKANSVAAPEVARYEFAHWELNGEAVDPSVTVITADTTFVAVYNSLDDAIEKSVSELDSFYNNLFSSVYRADKWTELTTMVNLYKQKLQTVNTIAECDTIYDSAISAVNAITTIADELAEYVKSIDCNLYYEDKWQEILGIMTEAVGKIDFYNGGAPMPAYIYNQAVTMISGVPTIEEEKEEAKYQATVNFRKLEQYAKTKENSGNKTLLAAILASAKAEMADASCASEVVSVYNKYLKQIDEIGDMVIYTVRFLGYNGSEISVVTVNEGECVELPEAPEREGWNFIGWGIGNNSANLLTAETPITSDMVVFACYQMAYYTVTFKLDDGTVVRSAIFPYGMDIVSQHFIPTDEFMEANYAREGYEFAGWDPDPYDCTSLTSDMTFTAVYDEIQIPDSVDSNDFSEAEYGMTYVYVCPVFIRPDFGYTRITH